MRYEVISRQRGKRLKAEIRLQARAAVKGQSLSTPAYKYMAEYISRQRLAKLGFMSSLSDLDINTAQIFVIISQEIDKAQQEEQKRGRK